MAECAAWPESPCVYTWQLHLLLATCVRASLAKRTTSLCYMVF